MYINGERAMAYLARIEEVKDIPDADKIQAYRVGGWWVVDRKSVYQPGDLVVYVSIDAWVPHSLAPFLCKTKEPRVYNGVPGERLRTVRLKKQISQGLLLPLSPTCDNIESELVEGLNVSVPLNIQKWEAEISAQLAGEVRGRFPSCIPKTDQERVQNLAAMIARYNVDLEHGLFFQPEYEVTEKLEGSSMTCYLIDGEFGVCSRNMDLKKDENNTFWKVAIEQEIEHRMREFNLMDYAIQGELVGPGIQGNIYNLSQPDFFVFDIYNIKTGTYLLSHERRSLVNLIGLKHVPVLVPNMMHLPSVDDYVRMADGKSALNHDQAREGLVFKDIHGGVSFKAVSNAYLINEKE